MFLCRNGPYSAAIIHSDDLCVHHTNILLGLNISHCYISLNSYNFKYKVGRGSSQSRLLVPHSCKSARFVLMARRCGMASLLSCASYLRHFPTHSIIVLLFLTVLELGAPLSSSGLEEAL